MLGAFDQVLDEFNLDTYLTMISFFAITFGRDVL